MIEGLRESRVFQEKDGYVFPHHLAACKMCAKGSRAFFLSCGLSKAEVTDFYKNGMLIEDFDRRFGHDAMAQQVIQWVRDGK